MGRGDAQKQKSCRLDGHCRPVVTQWQACRGHLLWSTYCAHPYKGTPPSPPFWRRHRSLDRSGISACADGHVPHSSDVVGRTGPSQEHRLPCLDGSHGGREGRKGLRQGFLGTHSLEQEGAR